MLWRPSSAGRRGPESAQRQTSGKKTDCTLSVRCFSPEATKECSDFKQSGQSGGELRGLYLRLLGIYFISEFMLKNKRVGMFLTLYIE